MLRSSSNANKKTESLFLVVTLLLVLNITTNTPSDFDMWWHLRSGNEMWNLGKILLQDSFSYTRNGAPWVNAFWISDIGMYGIWKLGGFFALTIVVSLIAVGVMSIIYFQLEGSIYLRALLLLIATFAAGVNWSPRPQILSFILLAGLDYYLYYHHNIRRRPLWVMAPLFALWGNLHGGFIWGILVLIATISGDLADNLMTNQPVLKLQEVGNLTFWTLAGGLAVLINPNGLAIWKLPFYQVKVSLIAITEWLSPDFHNFFTHPALWLLFLLIIGIAFSKRQLSFADLFKGLGFTYMLFVAQRNMAPYAIIITPIIGRQLGSAVETFKGATLFQKIKTLSFLYQRPSNQVSEKVTFLMNTILVSILAAFFLISAYIASAPSQIEAKVPAKAVRWIAANHPNGPIFNSYNWGGYLTWELRDYPVYMDGRADLYGDQIINEWLDIANGRNKGISALNDRGIKLIFLEPNWPLIDKLPQNGWKELYSDEKISIYGR